MTEKELQIFKAWFREYVDAYYTGDKDHDETIKLKQDHTWRVCEEICFLGQSLNFDDHKKAIAEAAALFHDVGRFEQYARYGTFKDAASENHATLGLKELKRCGILSHCGDEERDIILHAIRHHNCRSLPQIGDDSILVFAKLLRDADKLDIWKIMLDYYEGVLSGGDLTLIWGLPDRPVYSPRIIEAFSRNEMADIRHMKTLCDYKLLQISWIFDINFVATVREVQTRKYVERIAATIPETLETREAIETARSYLVSFQNNGG